MWDKQPSMKSHFQRPNLISASNVNTKQEHYNGKQRRRRQEESVFTGKSHTQIKVWLILRSLLSTQYVSHTLGITWTPRRLMLK